MGKILFQLDRKSRTRRWNKGGRHRNNFFLPHNNIRENRQKYVTYGRIVVDYCSQKDDPYHNHPIVSVNLIK